MPKTLRFSLAWVSSSFKLFIVFWIILELGLARSAKSTNSLAGETAFDRAIQEVGGIRRGEVSYLAFSDQFNPELHAAVRERFEQFLDNSSSPITYSYAEIDLNGDGRNEAFVKVNSSFAAGSGGVHTLVFQANTNIYELIHVFLHQVSLVILPNQTSGWRDILVVPGRIFTPNFGIFYSRCSYNAAAQNSSGVDYLSSPTHYRDCQEVQRNSTIDGVVIHTGGFNVSYPEFEL